QSYQNLVKHACGIELARSLQEERQLLQIRGVGGNLYSGNLAEELARGVGAGMMRMKNHIRHIADAELHPVIALQRFALYPFSVHERTVLTALVNHAKLPVFRSDQR